MKFPTLYGISNVYRQLCAKKRSNEEIWSSVIERMKEDKATVRKWIEQDMEHLGYK